MSTSAEPTPDLSSLNINHSPSTANPWDSSPGSAAPTLAEPTPSGSFWTSQEAQIKAIPKVDTDEFDPFAPNKPRSDTPTLGSTVKPSSRLELLPAEDDDQPSHPPDWNAQLSDLSSADANPQSASTPSTSTARPKVLPLIGGTGREGSGSAFLGMFRSRSGGGSPRAPPIPLKSPPVSQADSEKGMLASELSEKGGQGHAHFQPGQAGVTSQGEGSAGPANALNSIANVFRSASSRNGSTSGTPVRGGSPTEKEAYLEMARGGSAQGVTGAEQHHGTAGAKGKEVDRAPAEAVFDFNKFLEQMRQRSADPIAKYLRSYVASISSTRSA